MARKDTTLAVATRSEFGSRTTRRLRRRGLVPGIVYGGEAEAQAVEVDALLLRNTLASAGAVLQLEIDGGSGDPVVVKETQRHPVRGEIMHLDLLRVDMAVAIHTTVTLELTGTEEAPGVIEGGVLDQPTRELNVEALPGAIPESIVHDVSTLQMGDTITLSAVAAPDGVTLLDELEETVVASVMAPTLEPVEEEIEAETELVGEGGEIAEEQAEGATQDEAESAAGSGDDAAEQS